jgi:cephalosporin hydroxylase
MKIMIDTDKQKLVANAGGEDERTFELYEKEAFELLSREWLRAGWNCDYSYGFEWCGRRIIQLPEDVIRLQELVWRTRPTVIVETGIAHGGSTVMFASLLKLTAGRRVISVDIEIRPHNREGLEAHPFIDMCTLIEKSSVDPDALNQVKSEIRPDDRVMVVLDSNHTKAHVAEELELYSPLVTPGCYIVATDGVMQLMADLPRGKPEWRDDNPTVAAEEFLAKHPEYSLDDSYALQYRTYFPGGYLRRKEEA